MTKPQWHSSDNRAKEDFYPTPREATEALLSVEEFSDNIWEPASGKGHISKVLKTAGHKVFSTDLMAETYGFGLEYDFLSFHVPTQAIDDRGVVFDIVTNPPYSKLRRFVEHAVTICEGKVAMLLPWNCLGVDANLKLFEQIGFPSVLLLGPTLNIETSKGVIRSQFFHCWCIWNQNKPIREFYYVKPLRWKPRKEK